MKEVNPPLIIEKQVGRILINRNRTGGRRSRVTVVGRMDLQEPVEGGHGVEGVGSCL